MAKLRRDIKSAVRSRISEFSAAFREDVKEEIQDIARDVEKLYDDIVDDWEHKPGFKSKVTIGADYIELIVTPSGDEETIQIFDWVDKGTAAHIIVPKNPNGWLTFQTDYSPHTAPDAKFRQGDGEAYGDWVRVKFVNHPGTAPRDFRKAVKKKFLPAFRLGIENAFRRATRR